MIEKFGLQELEALAREMKVGSKDARTITLICKVTGMQNTITADIREAITRCKSAVRNLKASINNTVEEDNKDNLRAKMFIKEAKAGRKAVKVVNKSAIKRFERDSNTENKESERLVKLQKKFGG